MSNPDERLDLVENRLDTMERLLAETIQIVQSNAKSNLALANTLTESNRQQAELNRQQAELNRLSTDRMDRLTDQMAETNRQIASLADYFGTLARVVHDHENDDERHN